MCVTTESVDLKSKFKPPIHPPHPHPSPETPYQHPGTMGGPIRPPKQQYIPPKQSIFPEHPLLWVTTGSIGLKSKIKPPTQCPSLTRDPISTLWDHGGTHQTPQTTIHTHKTICFSLVPSIVSNNRKHRPKIQSQTTHLPTPSPSLTRDPISTLWDHGGPLQTPQTTTHPQNDPFFLSALDHG